MSNDNNDILDQTDVLSLIAEQAIEVAKKEGKFIPKDIWALLEKRKAEGKFTGEIAHHEIKTIINLTKGDHYFVIENVRRRSIVCKTCPVKHGGILEAHLLTRYKIEEGVLSLDGVAINTTPLDKKEMN